MKDINKKIIYTIFSIFLFALTVTGVKADIGFEDGPGDSPALSSEYVDTLYFDEDSELIPNGTYVIGTHMFTRNVNDDYNGRLTTPRIMLAATTIKDNYGAGFNFNEDDMIIYYKNSSGNWINGLTGEEERPYYFIIKYIDLQRVSDVEVDDELLSPMLEDTFESLFSNNSLVLEYRDYNDYSELNEDQSAYLELVFSGNENGSYGTRDDINYTIREEEPIIDITDLPKEDLYIKARVCISEIIEGEEVGQGFAIDKKCSELSDWVKYETKLSIDSITNYYTPELLNDGFVISKVDGNFFEIELLQNSSFGGINYSSFNGKTYLPIFLKDETATDYGVIAYSSEPYGFNPRSVTKTSTFNPLDLSTGVLTTSSVDSNLTVPEVSQYHHQFFLTNKYDENDEKSYEYVGLYQKIDGQYTLVDITDDSSIDIYDENTYAVRSITLNDDNTISYSNFSDDFVYHEYDEGYWEE